MDPSEVYIQERSQILMMNPLPSMGRTNAIIMTDESQHMITDIHTRGDALSSPILYAGKGKFQK